MSVYEEQSQNEQENKKNILESFGVNLTQKAANNELDPVIGRDKEIYRATQILSRKKKNNPLIVGNPGSGKTSLVFGIAQRIVDKDVSYALQDKEIWSLNLAAMVAGTKYRGEFEQKMVNLIAYLKENKQIIIFFDEIHTILGAGGASGSLDAANILKPALSNGEIQCIGATTFDEYRENIEKDGALKRRFQKIHFEDPTIEETKLILKNLKATYEKFHNVKFSDEVIEKIPELAVKYITDRHLPDSAIDIIDESGAKAQIESVKVSQKLKKLEHKMDKLNIEKFNLLKTEQWVGIKDFVPKYKKVEIEIDKEKKKFQEEIENRKKVDVGEKDILEIVSFLSNIPLDKLDTEGKNKIKIIQTMFDKNLIGQTEAVDLVVKALKRSIMGMSSPNKPIASLLLLGKTGVGKCVTKDGKITIRNKTTGEVETLSMEKFNTLTE